MSETIEDNRSAVRKQWDSFKGFAWNPTEKTVMGRTGRSWAKILVFYMFYYGFLACLFAASISIVLGTLDEYTPKYQTRVQTPGIAIQPKIPSNLEQTSDIKYSLSQDRDYGRLVTQMETFLWAYSAENQTAEKGFHPCAMDQPPSLNQEFKDDQKAMACSFDRSTLGPCAVKPYGYDKGEPCIFVKVNRIIHWSPVGYTNLSRAVGNEQSSAPPLADLLATYGQAYKPFLIYTYCYGDEQEDKDNLNGGVITNTKFYPDHMGLPFVYYPYLGKKRQPGYVNPIVAVQFTNVTRDVSIDVICKVYALNIRDNKDMGEGYFKFKMEIKK